MWLLSWRKVDLELLRFKYLFLSTNTLIFVESSNLSHVAIISGPLDNFYIYYDAGLPIFSATTQTTSTIMHCNKSRRGPFRALRTCCDNPEGELTCPFFGKTSKNWHKYAFIFWFTRIINDSLCFLCFLCALQVYAEFNRIATTNLENDFFDALDHFTPRFVNIFKTKKGSVGEKLAEIVQQIDSGVSLLMSLM